MASVQLFLFGLLVALLTVWCGAEGAEEPYVVVHSTELDDKTFDEFLEKHPVTLIAFVASWCGHCQKLKKPFDLAALALKEKFPLALLDAAAHSEISSRFSIQGYPTLLLFRKGKPEPYDGGRQTADIVAWMKKMTSPAVTEVADAAAADELAKQETVAYVGSFKAKDNAAMKVFNKVADTSRALGTFISYIADKDEVRVFRISEDVVATTTDIADVEKLKAFFLEAKSPDFGPVGPSNYQELDSKKLPFVWFAGNKSDYDTHFKVVREAATSFRGQLIFVWLDTLAFIDHAKGSLGLEEFPSLVLDSRNREFKPVGRYNYKGGFTDPKKIVDFVAQVKAGKIPAELKSEEIPETNDEPVKVVVGKNFEEMIIKSNKHVLLEIYAPWCGHCKQFAPEYEQIAGLFDSKDIIVAKLDGTTNEIQTPGFSYSGFPTIYAVPKGGSPIQFSGTRNKGNVTEWFAGVIGVPIPKPAAEEEAKDEL